MNYTKYSAEDFALDERFQKWVLDPDPAINEFWEKWLGENPGQKSVINDAVALVRTAGLSGDHRINEEYLEVWKHLQQNVTRSETLNPNRTWRYVSIAAVLAFVIVSSFLLSRAFMSRETIEYRTAYGEVKEVLLEDGSKVTLNANSLLSVARDWREHDVREVTLEGEAFFEIVKTSDKKSFEVSTNADVRISVLGTEFNVNTRQDEVKVYLQSGKVRVNSGVGEATLNPGDFVWYRNGNTELTVNRNITESSEVLSWREGVFIFNDTPLADVVHELEDNYGFSITLMDKSLKEKRITAKIPRKDIDVLLNVLSEALDITIERNGRQLTMK